ncbi:MAG TPA: NUDIX domain-containing protein [Candidatus Paceibacterota bacterium]|nr:NUDIX domain-containing protein [Candidatus Paceibacterota bacterium]
MQRATLCFLLRGEDVCQAQKKRGFGAGKLNAYGGKFKKGESARACAVRETFEESGARIYRKDLKQVAIVATYFGRVPAWELHVFVARKWKGEPRETVEMGKPKWSPRNALPEDEMLSIGRYWVPRAVMELSFKAEVYLSRNGKNVRKIVFRKATFR